MQKILALVLLFSVAPAQADLNRLLVFTCEAQLARMARPLRPFLSRPNYNRLILLEDARERLRTANELTPELFKRADPSFPLDTENPLGIVTLFRARRLYHEDRGFREYPAGAHLWIENDYVREVVAQASQTAADLNAEVLAKDALDSHSSPEISTKIGEIHLWYRDFEIQYLSTNQQLYAQSGSLLRVRAGHYLVLKDGLLIDVINPTEDYRLRAMFTRRMLNPGLPNIRQFMKRENLPTLWRK